MKNKIITEFENRIWKNVRKAPAFRPGDTVKVHYKIQEGADKTKFRIQPYEGIVTRYRKGTADASFTVRKIGAGGVGVERAFPLYSPFIEKIEVVANGVVRRARLYYLRNLEGKAARVRSRYLGRRVETVIPGADQVLDAEQAAVVADIPVVEETK